MRSARCRTPPSRRPRTTGSASWASRESRPARCSCVTRSRSKKCCCSTSRSLRRSHTKAWPERPARGGRWPLEAKRALRGGQSGGLVEAEFLDGLLAHLELLDLSGHRHRELVDELPVPRDLVGRDLAFAPRRELITGRARALAELHPGHDLFAVALGRHADHLHVCDVGVRV